MRLLLQLFLFLGINSQNLSVKDLVQLYGKNRYEIAKVIDEKNFKLIYSDEYNVYYKNKNDDSVLKFAFLKNETKAIGIRLFITNKQVYNDFKNEIENELKGKFEKTHNENIDKISYQGNEFTINHANTKRSVEIGEATKNVTWDIEPGKVTFKYIFVVRY